MAQTTSAKNALDCQVKLANASAVLKDISGSAASIEPTLAHELGMARTGDSKWPLRLDGGKDATFTLNVVYSTGGDEGLALLRDWWFADPPGSRSIEIYVPDENAGSDLYYGKVRIGNLSFPLDYSDPNPIAVTAELAVDGPWLHTTTT